MIRLLSKLGLTGSTLAGIIFVDVNTNNSSMTRQELKKNNQKMITISSLEDIELFEKTNNCTFGFVGVWNDKKVWKAREFLKSYKGIEWKNKVIAAAEKTKRECKSKKQVALFGHNRNGFVIDKKRFSKK